MTLQRSLLPQTLPDQGALDIATRYLPAGTRAGVGGDWFDVIPLSGARVALVVGDVVGHGIRASATMGRLRTAVRTLADVDLPPDELLTHLDDLVLHLSADEGGTDGADESAGGIGTTCLYAVYDPVSRRCALARGRPPAARRGHPGRRRPLPRRPGRPAAGPGRPAVRDLRDRTARGQPPGPLHRRSARRPRPRHRRGAGQDVRRPRPPREDPRHGLRQGPHRHADPPSRRRHRPARRPHPGPARRPGRRLGPGLRPGRRRPGPQARHRAADRLGAGRRRLHHRTDGQ
nr:serine/threonine-protein phosphatase [Streptomyces sp. S1D4-11]